MSLKEIIFSREVNLQRGGTICFELLPEWKISRCHSLFDVLYEAQPAETLVPTWRHLHDGTRPETYNALK